MSNSSCYYHSQKKIESNCSRCGRNICRDDVIRTNKIDKLIFTDSSYNIPLHSPVDIENLNSGVEGLGKEENDAPFTFTTKSIDICPFCQIYYHTFKKYEQMYTFRTIIKVPLFLMFYLMSFFLAIMALILLVNVDKVVLQNNLNVIDYLTHVLIYIFGIIILSFFPLIYLPKLVKTELFLSKKLFKKNFLEKTALINKLEMNIDPSILANFLCMRCQKKLSPNLEYCSNCVKGGKKQTAPIATIVGLGFCSFIVLFGYGAIFNPLYSSLF